MRFLLLLIFLSTLNLKLAAAHYPSTLTNEEWLIIAPYLLPDTHPIKPDLDRIFASERAIRTQDSLEKAGFQVLTEGHWSDTVIATHKEAKGFFFKLFTEDQTHVDEIPRLVARIQGACLAQKIVDKYQWQHLFKVPRKWLYLLPDDSNPLPGVPSKRMILIAEDMRLLPREDSYSKWKDSALSHRLLKAVFTLLTEGGFSDSAYAFNLPFAKDGRIAIIDNDKHNKRPVPCSKLLKYLHPKNKKYWEKLIKNAGPEAAF